MTVTCHPLGFTTVIVTNSGNLLSGCKSMPMPGTLGPNLFGLCKAWSNEFDPSVPGMGMDLHPERRLPELVTITVVKPKG
jgi:hypothetical protein